MNSALVMVDLQNDFCPGGALAVAEGDVVIPIANRLQPLFKHIIASQDWHPQDHLCFAANHQNQQVGNIIQLNNISQCLWPIHCVQNSAGAKFHPNLQINSDVKIIRKGMDRFVDSYSAFFDNNHSYATGLAEYLAANKINKIYVMGLATDYCVKYTALDAKSLGLEVIVIVDGCRGVNLQPADSDRALQEMRAAGVEFTRSADLLSNQ